MVITDAEIAAAEAQVEPLPPSELAQIQPLLEAFCIRHQSHHRPIALVTSGGTATDLEVNSVRFLDNFSTGLRGAVSAEQFLRRGYAVIYLWREGSAAPYTRTLSSALGTRQANHGLGFDALGRLFDFPGEEGQQDEEERMINQVRSNDPWLTDTSGRNDVYHDGPSSTSGREGSALDSSQVMLDTKNGPILLNRRLFASSEMEIALRERAEVVKQGLLLTVKFRSVDEYLAKLQLCSRALYDSQSLGVIYLAAAVSDFYIPKAKRSLHKIQSQDYGTGGSESTVVVDADNCLTLKLHPVPKLIPALRKLWAPHAFTVSFKLETDTNILRHKAMLAMKRYGPHMVVGNILETRHEKVWILQQTNDADDSGDASSKDDPTSVMERGFEMKEISKKAKYGGGIDELEDAMIGHIVEKHFEYVANHIASEGEGGGRTALMAGAEAAAKHNRHLAEKKARLQSELYWKRVKDMSLTLAGHALGMLLTWSLSTALQSRFRR